MKTGREGLPESGRTAAPDSEAPGVQASDQMRLLAAHRRRVQRKRAQAAEAKAGGPKGAGSAGAPLQADVRAKMEGQLGADLSQVRVHTDERAQKAADGYGARAFTVGDDVHFGAGEYNPGTREGDGLIAHELTHVVQGQKSGVQRKAEEEGEEEQKEEHQNEEGAEEEKAEKEEVSEPDDAAEVEADKVEKRVANNLHGGKGKDKEKEKEEGEQHEDRQEEKQKKAEEQGDMASADGEADAQGGEQADAEAKEESEAGAEGETEADSDDGAKQEAEVGEEAAPEIGAKLKTGTVTRKGKGPKPKPLPPVETKADRKTGAELKAMTLQEFDAQANKQVDWANGLDAGDKPELRKVLQFARSGDILLGCGGMTVQAIIDSKLTNDVKKGLTAYSSAVSGKGGGVSVPVVDDLAKAVEWGEASAKLNKGLGAVTARQIIKQDDERTNLQDLIDYNSVDALIEYNKVSKPMLHANNGSEIDSFIDYLAEAGDPNKYHAKLKNVRNYHRFHPEALDQLEVNEKAVGNDPKAGGKPFTLILHTALDHNGAFHRDPNMKDVLTSKANLTIMIEGKSTLEEIQDQLKPLAKAYGGGKINQVMIAGHGGPRGIQLAGKLKEELDPETKEKSIGEDSEKGSLDLDKNKKKTDKFLDALLDNMANDGGDKNRMVFNACLTNADEISNDTHKNLDKDDPEKSKEVIKKALADNPTLTETLQQKADDKGLNVDARGSNASFGQVGLIDGSDKLDLIDKSVDPVTNKPVGDRLTAPKMEYVEFGQEPEGVMRAVLRTWAEDQANCVAAMTRRVNLGASKEWREALIRGMFELVLKDEKNAKMINYLAEAASYVAHAEQRDHARVNSIKFLPEEIMDHLYAKLMGTDSWASLSYIPLVFYQAWMKSDESKGDNLKAHLDAKYKTCKEASEFIDTTWTGAYASKLLTKPAGPSGGEMKLAFLLLKAGNEEAKNFVSKVLDKKTTLEPAHVEMLKGFMTEDQVMEKLGRGDGGAPVDADADGGEVAPDANLDLDMDDKNEMRVESFVRDGKVKVALRVRAQPNTSSKILKVIYPGDPVSIIGKTGEWYAIEHDGGGQKTAFVHSAYVKLI